ncbi:MerR family transcriptional regulator [Actinosynnema pretiosum]|uniref:MerR family transcriptional regulator n=1 Tax=Actinosynnema pretiosum TaxID=42197 RepID=A0A290ZF52_9PSEU|nr:TipAS antibiotic-recognition domain-containing protein [Actinosynnema pretiosum]ATE57599.1 MerR family transcriptional regulator [Actinosynnema pretiosum]
MSWSIAEVARMAKVTSRTLRHYDAIGLLAPARTGGNGYRYYEREQLLRLQQILLLRDLGLGLDTVAEVLDGRHTALDVLHNHLAWLRAERERLALLAATVTRTIDELEGRTAVSRTEELFDGFDADLQARYEAELVERFGERVVEPIAEGKERMKGWSPADAAGFKAEWEEIAAAFGEVAASGAAPDSAEALAVTARHHRWLLRSWTPNRESYTGLGQLYADSPEFSAQLDAHGAGVANYTRDAMAAFAAAELD